MAVYTQPEKESTTEALCPFRNGAPCDAKCSMLIELRDCYHTCAQSCVQSTTYSKGTPQATHIFCRRLYTEVDREYLSKGGLI